MGWVLRSSWGLGGIRGHSLDCVYFFFRNPGLLGLLGRAVKRERERGLGRAVLANFCYLEGNVSLGAGKA